MWSYYPNYLEVRMSMDVVQEWLLLLLNLLQEAKSKDLRYAYKIF